MATIRLPQGIQHANAQPASSNEMPLPESSYLQHASYDPATFQLTITFKGGGQRVHFMFFPLEWEQFKVAPSKGSFYAHGIRDKHPALRTIDTREGPARKKEEKTTNVVRHFAHENFHKRMRRR